MCLDEVYAGAVPEPGISWVEEPKIISANEQPCWRVVVLTVENEWMSLYHRDATGISSQEKRRPFGEWQSAGRHLVIATWNKRQHYISGFHSFLTKEDAMDYTSHYRVGTHEGTWVVVKATARGIIAQGIQGGRSCIVSKEIKCEQPTSG